MEISGMDKTTYRNTIRKMKRDGKTTLCCIICGEDNPSVIEIHHLYGKANSDEAVPLCMNCHKKITDEQNKFPPDKRSGAAYAALSAGTFFRLLSERLVKVSHEVVNDGRR